jgi:hypothetical protein
MLKKAIDAHAHPDKTIQRQKEAARFKLKVGDRSVIEKGA